MLSAGLFSVKACDKWLYSCGKKPFFPFIVASWNAGLWSAQNMDVWMSHCLLVSQSSYMTNTLLQCQETESTVIGYYLG